MNAVIIPVFLVAALQISSPAFKNNDYIPSKYTCEGDNVSPALTVTGIPSGTKSLAVTVFDPDAGTSGVVHWVQWNLPPSQTIVENTMDGIMGNNVRGKAGYTGPCPPTGVHHYHFMVYALDTTLPLAGGAGKSDLEKAMQGHILAQGELVGLYKKVK